MLNSSICMQESSLMIPLEKMMNNSALISKCLGKLYIQHPPSVIQLQDGLNSLDNVSGNITICITNKHTGLTSNMEVDTNDKQCSNELNSIFILVGGLLLVLVLNGSVLIVVVLVVCAGVVMFLHKKKNNKVAQSTNIRRNDKSMDTDNDCSDKLLY